MRVEYVGAGPKQPKVTNADRRGGECTRLTNGLNAIEGHCDRCDNRIRVSKPMVYRVRDNSGHIITADWVVQ